jgi:predicted alpha/beta-fold hydrolase
MSIAHRERWLTPDGDFVDADWFYPCSDQAPRGTLVLFHGLEGSSDSHYARAFRAFAAANRVALVVPHFRGCSGEINWAPRAYHSGDHVEIGWMLEQVQLRVDRSAPTVAAGVSLGGNALLRWAQEAGHEGASKVCAVAAISSPLDLTASGEAIGRGFNRWVYTTMFLRSMKPKALAKLEQFPGLFDRNAVLAARDLYAFDNVFTAPLHGFKDTSDYWLRASSAPGLSAICIPTLTLNAKNDPFVPIQSLPPSTRLPSHIEVWHPAHGGHVGFPRGRWPGHVNAMPQAVGQWLFHAAGIRVSQGGEVSGLQVQRSLGGING